MKFVIPILFLILASVVLWNFLKKPKKNNGFSPEVIEKTKVDKAAREKVRFNYPKLFEEISECLYENDPLGINFETNTDEYDPEVGTIIPRLSSCSSENDVLNVVYEEFCKWFGEDSTGTKESYTQISIEIWHMWKNKQTQIG